MRYYLCQETVEPHSPFSLHAEAVRPAFQYVFFYLYSGFTGGLLFDTLNRP